MLTVVVEFVSDWTDRACGGAARTCTDAGAGAGGALILLLVLAVMEVVVVLIG